MKSNAASMGPSGRVRSSAPLMMLVRVVQKSDFQMNDRG